jgi:alpha-D-xyloside xylohydrolase
VAKPQTAEQQGRMSIWSEMAKDMDYYFIAGRNADEVIAGYRTLTGKAQVYPSGHWVLAEPRAL